MHKPRIVHLAVKLSASPDTLYDQYLNPKTHAAITGAPVSIAPRAGIKFRAFGGELRGTILQVVPKRLIVQSWRASSHWKLTDIDSTLILTFWPDGRGARIELIHANVADHDFAGVSRGWEQYYWMPWRKYLQEQKQGKKIKSKSRKR